MTGFQRTADESVATWSAKRGSNRELRVPGNTAADGESGDVGARDEEQKSDCAEEHNEHGARITHGGVRSGRVWMRQSRLADGNCSSIRPAIADRSGCACSSVACGARRPTT